MSADPDDLESAEIRGWEEGKHDGFNDGLRRAGVIIRDRASELFLAEREDEARALRDAAIMVVEAIVQPGLKQEQQ